MVPHGDVINDGHGVVHGGQLFWTGAWRPQQVVFHGGCPRRTSVEGGTGLKHKKDSRGPRFELCTIELCARGTQEWASRGQGDKAWGSCPRRTSVEGGTCLRHKKDGRGPRIRPCVKKPCAGARQCRVGVKTPQKRFMPEGSTGV